MKFFLGVTLARPVYHGQQRDFIIRRV